MSKEIRKNSEDIGSFDTKDKDLAITSIIEQAAKEFCENDELKVRYHLLSILKIYELKVMKERHEHRK